MDFKSGLRVTIDTNFDTNPNFPFVSNAIFSDERLTEHMSFAYLGRFGHTSSVSAAKLMAAVP
jgi:hypothetical protein